VGRLKLASLGEEVARFLQDPDPELRAAALRALWRLGFVPSGLEEVVLAHLQAPEEYLRLQATRLLPLLGKTLARRALWKALYDPSFYVRRAAAEGLRELGLEALAEAARAHPDPYGRAMAQQVLREAA
jgi:HEAT repeat protein